MPGKRALRPTRWLHLSDLHLGCPEGSLWWEVENDFEQSLRETAEHLGPPDMVLFTGDLAYSGKTEEYDKVDDFLTTLLQWLRESCGNPDPVLLTVPGNHDVAQPSILDEPRFSILDKYGEGDDDAHVKALNVELFRGDELSAGYLEPLLGQYHEWFKRRIVPQLKEKSKDLNVSHIPGDFRADFEFPGTAPLTVVGLNSTWIQYKKGNYEGMLDIPREQFQFALSKDVNRSMLKDLGKNRQALLMMHQPPCWLSKRALSCFHESIYTPERFAACLFGHMHQARSETAAISGGAFRYFYQAPSLFGLEHYGTRRENRAFGYSWGNITEEGEVRVWPLERVIRGGGKGVFIPDTTFETEKDGSYKIGPIKIKDENAKALEMSSIDWNTYLTTLLDRTGYIEIVGIGAGGGREAGAGRYAIEKLYTPLRSRDTLSLESSELEERMLQRSEILGLSDILPKSPRLLIEGQPGSGKTTFLNFIATMLGRDNLNLPCPDGRTWAQHYLGLDTSWKGCVPLFLRLALLVPRLQEADEGLDDRSMILDLIETAYPNCGIKREEWEGTIQQGKAVLLLDGLDEVVDSRIRKRLFSIFRDACREWKDCPVVVTSRPFKTTALRDMGFHHTVIEPFSPDEIQKFTRRWVGALPGFERDGDLTGEAQNYRQRLLDAILDRPMIRRMATNPVMLTCLCVVHWNEKKQLPEGRSRVYQAVVRWLIDARTKRRQEDGFTNEFAEQAFRRLALSMMGPGEDESKKVLIDIEDAALALDPVVSLEYQDLPPNQQRARAREWLRFECLGSGIIEEVGQNRIRFWHLTFQEYLAAVQLNEFAEGSEENEGGEENWWPVIKRHLRDPQWRETVELFPGCLLEQGRRRVDKLLKNVFSLFTDNPDFRTQAGVVGIINRMLQPLVVYKYKPDPGMNDLYQSARDQAMEIFTPKGAMLPINERIEVAEALGQGGDPRLSPEGIELPNIPGMPGLKMGKFPVTVEEYQRFLDARGYEERKYWEEVGWSIKQYERWESPGKWDEQLKTPNRPVVSVSWYEADAYCRWMSEGQNIRIKLPSASEWQAAAKPVKGKYPWGEEEPNEELVNFDSNIGNPTPVGVYPRGVGPGGHMDLAGNVWEWSQDEGTWDSLMDDYLSYIKREKYEGETARALRGGSYWSPAVNLRYSARNWSPAGDRSDSIGFRVLSAPASTVDG